MILQAKEKVKRHELTKRHDRYFTGGLLGGMPVSALDLDQGDASQIQPAYVGVTSISPKLSINTSGAATCVNVIKVKTGYSVSAILELQHQEGSKWILNQSWKASGTSMVRFDKKYYVNNGYNYRLKSVVTVYGANGSVAEVVTTYSTTVKF